MFCFSFCFTSRQVRNGDDPDAQTSKHKFQTEQKLGKHDLPGNRSQKVAASHILYYYTKYIFNFMTRDHTLFFRIVQPEVVFFPYSDLRWVSPGTPASSTNKTDHHDIINIIINIYIIFKVALNTITR
jgi:hypothetical protein